MSIEQLFFQLLQVAIGTRKTLDRLPTSEEWALLFDMSKKQALTAIAFTGVTRLNEASDFGTSLGIPEAVYLKWLGLTAKVAQRNREVSAACVELMKQYAHDGLACCVLKGQGNLVNYPEDMRECRTPGDIDVWCAPAEPSGIDIAVADLDGRGTHYERYTGKRAVIEYVKMLWRLEDSKIAQEGQTPLCKNHEPEVRYHHIDAPTVNASTGSAQVSVEVEVHFRPLFLDSPLRNWRLQRWFRLNEQFGHHDAKIGDVVLPVPTTSFNAVYQLCHIYRHLFDEGIGLRQLLDYYFVLRALHVEQGELADRTESMAQWAESMGIAVKSNSEIMHTLGRFGMAKFASAIMWVLKEVFAMPDVYLLCPPDEIEGKFLLNEIMLAGNFGKYDSRIARGSKSFMGLKVSDSFAHAIEKTKHNLRLFTHYPEEVLWEPIFRVYHWVWRKLELWR